MLTAEKSHTNYQCGTNLGTSMNTLAAVAQRMPAGKRQLLVFSRGWDAGDAAALERALVRIRGQYATILWANPPVAIPGFEPVQNGMAGALPHIDHLVSGHSLATLEHVLGILTLTPLSRTTSPPPARRL